MLMIDFSGLNVTPKSFSFYIKKASSSFVSYLVQFNAISVDKESSVFWWFHLKLPGEHGS